MVQSARVWCEANTIDCLYFLADAGDELTVPLAEQNGFNLVDVRVTLQLNLQKRPSAGVKLPLEIRVASRSDRAALVAIARVSHRDTRFHYDRHFARERCDDLYATWIEQSCDGYADIVLVADRDGQAVGYVTGHLREQGVGQIGLFAVSSEYQGQGVGRALAEACLNWFDERGMKTGLVVTQGRNIAAQKLYQACGFRTDALNLWYHYWGKLRG
jgi:dTDP-4-amino-4,6-dideoxy-D-galactose acyltransferase